MSSIMTRAQMWERHAAIGQTNLPREEERAAYTALHREYFGAYVEAFNIQPPAHLVEPCKRALAAGDDVFNSPFTTLADWDSQMSRTAMIPGLVKTLRENGEGWCLSANICLLKEAMRRKLAAS